MSDCEKCTYNNAGKLKTNCTHPRIHTASGIHDCRHYEPSAGKLESENAELRQQLADVTESMGRVEERCAALRELVRILYYCGLPWKDCDKCAMNGAEMHVEISDVEFCDGMYDRMRELGIESKERGNGSHQT